MVDTIFALASAPGRAAVAIMRLSGPGTRAAVQTLTGAEPKARRPSLRALRRPGDGAALDQALVLWFAGPNSYTGEDVVELQLHGGAAVADGVTEALLGLGLRLAQPGEFTRRAFENGKLDLSQAEAIGDLVEAETDAQRRQALAQLGGDLARRHAAWREGLVEALALLEAAVDFPDEDLPSEVAQGAAPLIADVAREIDLALADGERGERVRDGYRVALIGAPNAGKSSLLNALAGREAAIVTATPGTPRDIIEAPLSLAGYRVVLGDTAGLRNPKGVIEAEGVRRATALAEAADLRLMVVDAAARDERWREAAALARPGDICVLNKRDLAPAPEGAAVTAWAAAHRLDVADVSVTRGIGPSGFARGVDRAGCPLPLWRRVSRRDQGATSPGFGRRARSSDASDAGADGAGRGGVGGRGCAAGGADPGAGDGPGRPRRRVGSRLREVLHRQVMFHVKHRTSPRGMFHVKQRWPRAIRPAPTDGAFGRSCQSLRPPGMSLSSAAATPAVRRRRRRRARARARSC